jgi:hypothetical protein
LCHQYDKVVDPVVVPQSRWFDFYVGAAVPDVGAAALGYERFALCSLGG